MKIVGIIVEYNPLHNGHLHHIIEVRKKTKADILIAVMSSNMTMRGNVSLFDKFIKTKQALASSVDLVIELPLVYSMQRADIFAKNSVMLLNLIGVDEIVIGSEENDDSIYEFAYKTLKNNESEIKKLMESGISYKAATSKFVNFKSNDQLGLAYYKAIKDYNYNIKLSTIKRIASDYLDLNPNNDNIASALAIRNNLNLIEKYTPSYVSKYKDVRTDDKIFPYLKYKILSSKPYELKNIFFVDEGIENRLLKINDFSSLDEFINSLVSKRYTRSRIQRMLYYILFNIEKNEMNNLGEIDFIRVLGYSLKGQEYLALNKKNINIYTNIKNNINKALDIELRATKILDHIYNTNTFKQEQKGPITL